MIVLGVQSVAVGSKHVRQFPQQQGSSGVVGVAEDECASRVPRLFIGTESGALTLAACAWNRRGGQTALIRAAAMGHAKTVTKLLADGAMVAIADVGGFNALHTAIIACVALVVAPKPLDLHDDDDDISEGGLARRNESALTTRVEVVRELIHALPPLPSSGQPVAGGHTPLSVLVQVAAEVPPSSELATQLVDTLLGVLLIEANPQGCLVDQPSGKLGRTPLLWAVHTGNPTMARRLLSHGASAHAQDFHGRNAVHTLVAAAAAGRVSSTVTLELLNLLVDKHGVSVSDTDSDGWTPLLLAVAGPPIFQPQSGSRGINRDTSKCRRASDTSSDAVVGETIVEWLLARGAGESVPVELADGRTAAAICLENGDTDGAVRLIQEQQRFAKARRRLLAAQQSRIDAARLSAKNARIAMEASAARAYADRVAAGSTESAVSAARRDTYGAAGDWWAEQQNKLSKRETAAIEARKRLAEAEAADMETAMQDVHTKLAELKSAEAWERHHQESWISPALPLPETANVSGLVAQNRVVATRGGSPSRAFGGEERWVEQLNGQVLHSVNTDTLSATLGEMGFLGGAKAAKRKARDEKTARVQAELAAQSAGIGKGRRQQLFSNETINGAIEPFGTLTFQHVGIRAFQGRNFHLTESITTLNILSCPELEEIPGVVCLMPGLTELNVSNNSLISLPSGVGKLTRLDTLRCSNNLLTTLPGALSMCLEMRTLDARQNGLASLPEDFAVLQWLETLDLTDNCFGTFPLPVLELGSLMHLFLGSNSMSRLPDLSVLELLASLDVSSNNLKELNPSVWQLPRLRELRAVDNNISELQVAEGTSFVRLQLRVLRLENNRITSLPVELAGLNNLVDVSLEGNLLADGLTGEDATVNQLRSTCEKHSGELLL
jgi:ankyrin repeat protein